MSIDIDWELLDERLTTKCLSALNTAFASVKRPSFLGDLIATDFAFGQSQPQVELVDIRDVYREFTEAEEEDERHDSPAVTLHHPPNPSWLSNHHSFPPPYASVDLGADSTTQDNEDSESSTSSVSLQFHVRFSYSGDLRIGIKTALIVNHPTPNFMALPLSLCVTGIAFDGIIVLAYEGDKRRMHISLIDAGTDDQPDTSYNGPTSNKRKGAKFLSDLAIESEIGQTEKHVLRNVGKVERFVLDVARTALEDEIIFPNFQSFLY